jgi:hypothetical protein
MFLSLDSRPLPPKLVGYLRLCLGTLGSSAWAPLKGAGEMAVESGV